MALTAALAKPFGGLDMATRGSCVAPSSAARRGRMTLDLSGFRFIDLGLRLSSRRTENTARRVRLRGPAGSPAIQRLFEVAGVTGRCRSRRGAWSSVLTDGAQAVARLDLLMAAGELADGMAPAGELVARMLALLVPALGDSCVLYGDPDRPRVVGVRVSGPDAAARENAVRTTRPRPPTCGPSACWRRPRSPRACRSATRARRS